MELKGKNILGTWKRSLDKLLKSDNIIPTERSGDTIELQNFILVITSPTDKMNDIVIFERTRGIDYYTNSYEKYWSSVNDRLKMFATVEGKTNQIEAIVDKLSNSPYNRQAYASIWSPGIDSISSYPLCIVGVYFFVRNNLLNMTAILRSNDAWGQALNDMYHLVTIQKEVADMLNISVGTYTHIAMSYHIYTSDLIKAKLFLEDDNNAKK
jgi:thymidylate synthase